MNSKHPIIKSTIDLALVADEAGFPIFATALLVLCRAACLGLSDHTQRALVNSSTMMVDALETMRRPQ